VVEPAVTWARIELGKARYPLFAGQVKADSDLRAVKVPRQVGDYYRDLFIHKLPLTSLTSRWFWDQVYGDDVWYEVAGCPARLQTTMLTPHPENKTARDIYNSLLENPAWNCKVVPAILSHDLDDVEYEPVVDEDSGTVVDVIVKTPAVETLWPGRWGIRELLLDMLASSVRSIWVREKLNDLRAMAGKVFRRVWFRYGDYAELPRAFERLVQVWDTAFEEDEGADWSVCITLALAAGKVYVLDVFRERLEFHRLVPAVKEQYRKWQPERVLVEYKASGKSAVQVLQAETTLPIVPVRPEGRDKTTRARAVTVYFETGRVVFVAGASWLAVFEDELVLFPEGAHDDQVDALVYGLLELMVGEEERPASAEGRVVSRQQVEALFG
jgi:predicted phage terminase large subunit-like protein